MHYQSYKNTIIEDKVFDFMQKYTIRDFLSLKRINDNDEDSDFFDDIEEFLGRDLDISDYMSYETLIVLMLDTEENPEEYLEKGYIRDLERELEPALLNDDVICVSPLIQKFNLMLIDIIEKNELYYSFNKEDEVMKSLARLVNYFDDEYVGLIGSYQKYLGKRFEYNTYEKMNQKIDKKGKEYEKLLEKAKKEFASLIKERINNKEMKTVFSKYDDYIKGVEPLKKIFKKAFEESSSKQAIEDYLGGSIDDKEYITKQISSNSLLKEAAKWYFTISLEEEYSQFNMCSRASIILEYLNREDTERLNYYTDSLVSNYNVVIGDYPDDKAVFEALKNISFYLGKKREYDLLYPSFSEFLEEFRKKTDLDFLEKYYLEDKEKVVLKKSLNKKGQILPL